jgi:hypothetical protein
MEKSIERCFNFQSYHQTISIESSLEPFENNFSEEDYSINDSIYPHSNKPDYDNDSIFLYFKDIEKSNSAIFSKNNNNKILDSIFRKDKQKETFSNIQINISTLSFEFEDIFPEKRETPFPFVKFSEKNPKKLNKPLGRKKKEETSFQQEDSSHGIFAEDNISIKIQTHYLNFIIAFLNCILPHINYNKKLFKLDKEFKIKNKVESLKDKTIGEIISNKISEKYKSINDKINANKNIYEEIKNYPLVNQILSENYLIFFKKFYYYSDSYINFKDYGLNKDIIFTKGVKNFKHLIKENEKRGDKYIKYIKEYTCRNYIPGLMFIC